jgi:chromosome partitioning protein
MGAKNPHRRYPHIVALVATKGGTGKSTVAACLAGELHARGYAVALLDTDPQRTLTSWHDNDGPLKAIPIGTANGASVLPALQSMAAQHSVVIVDTAGFQNRDTLAVLTLADLALVPFAPTPADALGTAQTVSLLREVNATVERRKNPVQITLLMNSAGRGALVPHIRAEVAATGARLLEASLHRRVAYAEAFLAGSAPCFMGSAAKLAAAEVAAIANEISF